MERCDTIVIGAGHNGLVCAAYLAGAGQQVRVLEASESPGGLAALREFHPGYRVPIAHTVGHLAQQVVTDLGLEEHGYRVTAALATAGVDPDGNTVSVRDGRLDGAGADDSAAYGEYSRLMGRFAGALSPFWLKTIPRIAGGSLLDALTFAHVGLNLRRLGKDDMREFLRVASLPVRDLMDEYFETDLVKTTIGWDGLVGSAMAPRSPNGAILTMLYRLGTHAGVRHAIPAADGNGLGGALAAAATKAGADIRYGTAVDRILVDDTVGGLAVRGVQLANGEQIEAGRVVSSLDPQRTFIDLVGVRHLDIEFTNRIRRLRSEGYVAKLHLALDGLPAFGALDRPDGRLIIAPDLDTIEFAWDAAKYGECPDEPVMEVVVPSLHEPALATDGGHVLSAHVMYVPRRLKGGWTDEARHRMRERSIDVLARYAPGIRERIVHAEFLAPADLERDYRVTGGHWHHVEFSMDQMLMMRPTHGAAQYATPLPHLYLCGAGCHPAGDLTGMPGHNAAREILR